MKTNTNKILLEGEGLPAYALSNFCKHVCIYVSHQSGNKQNVVLQTGGPFPKKRGRLPNYSYAVEIILILHLSRSTFVC